MLYLQDLALSFAASFSNFRIRIAHVWNARVAIFRCEIYAFPVFFSHVEISSTSCDFLRVLCGGFVQRIIIEYSSKVYRFKTKKALENATCINTIKFSVYSASYFFRPFYIARGANCVFFHL